MRLNIRYKMTLLFALIIAVVHFGIYLYLNHNLTGHAYKFIEKRLTSDISLIKSFLERSYTNDPDGHEIDRLADELGRDAGIRVTIINSDGTVLGDSELDSKGLLEVENHLYRPEVQEALQSGGIGKSKRFSTTIRKDMFYIATPFGIEKPSGIVRLSLPLVEIPQISADLKRVLIVSLLFSFILAIALSFIISLFITKPIKEMSSIAARIAEGDFSKRISTLTDDELGDLSCSFNNMTDHIRRKIEEVTSSKSKFEAVLLSMFEGVMVLDAKGVILLINKTLKDFLQIKDDPVGRKPLEVVRNIEIQEIAHNILKLHGGVESREISLLLPEEKILMVHATPILREGTTEGAVLVFHDISDLRRLEKIRRDFVANISHELRTPVSSIKGYAETLLDGALEDKENAVDFLKIIEADSDRLVNLIDDLLNLAKIESDKFKLNLGPCHIRPICERVVSELSRQAKDKSISLSIDVDADIQAILADENRITQVLLNLIDNAIKYTPERGSIIISVREQGDFVKVDVSDTGIGIPEQDIPRIFERFYRVDKARSRQLGGTGLGLSIVKHIVQAHGGEVFLHSILGKGSLFSFTIPKA